MTPTGLGIQEHLRAVDEQRAQRLLDPALAARVDALKGYQHKRFARTYGDLLQGGRYAAAARFFLDELYGPHDFSARDAQFARIVPAMIRLFPKEIVETVAALAALHALSEELDTEMARHLVSLPIDRAKYVRAWQRTGRPEHRARQIELTLTVARTLDHYTRNALLRHSLRLMRRPARAAGLAALQTFLERGFDTFSSMGGADEFLAAVETRERELTKRLFNAQFVATGGAGVDEAINEADPLRQLP